MIEDDLKSIDVEIGTGVGFEAGASLTEHEARVMREVVPRVVTEIRRLQGLITQVEWSASAGHIGGERACPWCRGNPECAVGGQPQGHRRTCPAFGSPA